MPILLATLTWISTILLVFVSFTNQKYFRRKSSPGQLPGLDNPTGNRITHLTGVCLLHIIKKLPDSYDTLTGASTVA